MRDARPIAWLVLCGILAVGCTSSSNADGDPPREGRLEQMSDLELTSPVFADGEAIPRRHGYRTENVSPPLRIANVPDGTASLALVVDDPDAVEPAGKVWDHWVVWNVPPDTARIAEDAVPDGAVQGENDFGHRRWDGPAPPDPPHTYRFKLYALDATLDLAPGSSKADLEAAIEGHVLGQTELRGTYPPGE